MLKKLKKKLKRYLNGLVRKRQSLKLCPFRAFSSFSFEKHENRDCLLYNK